MFQNKRIFIIALGLILFSGLAKAAEPEVVGTVDQDLGAEKEASRTDDDVVSREERAIKLDGLNVEQIKHMREQQEKHTFQAEVNRMMKLIINSLYRNKEVFCRELVSNASDALDKIRFTSLTDAAALESNPDLNIKVKADKENKILHITDTGIGMTKQDLINNLGMIAKSGTSEFFAKLQDADADSAGDLIGQFGVGFYSAFLVADKVVVTTKHNDDKQYIWESDASSYTIVEDPRGNTLGRGTTISLYLKDEAQDYLEVNTLKNLLKKYSQFINFGIYLWESKTEEVEEPIEEEEEDTPKEETDEDQTEDEEGKVEEEKDEEEKKPKTKKVQKTTWDWVLVNDSKPIWTRKPDTITDEEYNAFYKALAKESEAPLCKTHFIAEGEVTFKSLLFVPATQPGDALNRYGSKTENIKLYVRRVFITDDFQQPHDMLPNYLSFLRGLVDSDDLPLNVSRENLQQHKLLKVIKKKLVRKALDMFKKLPEEVFNKFWAEYSTNIKLGLLEDTGNRNRLAKLLKFTSSNGEMTFLADYVERMKEKQQHIFYITGKSLEEVKESPFVERLLKKGFEVLYLVEAVDEYAINALPEFEGKKFQNVAKEGLEIDDVSYANKKMKERLEEQFKPLTTWLGETALKDKVAKAEVSHRLSDSPCALVASRFGWTANMERIAASQTHTKTKDSQRDHQLNQKKMLEINPRHPLVKELLARVESNPDDETANKIALMMFRTATLRSGYALTDTVDFAKSVEELMRQTLGVALDAPVEEEPELEEIEEEEDEKTEGDEEEEETSEDFKDEL